MHICHIMFPPDRFTVRTACLLTVVFLTHAVSMVDSRELGNITLACHVLHFCVHASTITASKLLTLQQCLHYYTAASHVDEFFTMYDVANHSDADCDGRVLQMINDLDNCVNMTPPPLPLHGYVCDRILLPILTVVGVLGNLIVFRVFRGLSSRASMAPIRLYVSVLVIADSVVLFCLCYCLFAAPLLPVLNQAVLYMYFLGHCARVVSMWTSVLIAVDRWFAIRNPIKHRSGRSLRCAAWCVASVITFSVIFCLPRLFDLSVRSHRCNGTDDSWQVRYTHEGTPFRESPFYTRFYIPVCYTMILMALPFLAIFVFNVMIYRHLHHAYHQRGAMSQSRVSREHSTTVMLSLEAVVFLVCHSLPILINFAEFVIPVESHAALRDKLVGLHYESNLLICVSSSMNFFIFYIFGSRFRGLTNQYYVRNISSLRRFSTIPSNAVVSFDMGQLTPIIRRNSSLAAVQNYLGKRKCASFSPLPTPQRKSNSGGRITMSVNHNVVNGEKSRLLFVNLSPLIIVAPVTPRKVSAKEDSTSGDIGFKSKVPVVTFRTSMDRLDLYTYV